MDSSRVPQSPAGATKSSQPQVVTSPATPGAPPAPSKAPVEQPDVLPPSKVTGEFNVLCYTLLSLFIVCFCVWLIFAWIRYNERYAPNAEGWFKGATRSIEVTLVREDRQNLDCASDVVLEGLHCGYRANLDPFDTGGTTERVLHPYNTADNVLFLGAGLWDSPALAGPLPKERFTVVCNYRMVGAIKSVSLRWTTNGVFEPAKAAVPAGVVSDCVIPQ
jgi:hypothetical protein